MTSNNGFLVLQPRLLPENIATTEMQNPTLLLTDKLTHVVLKSFVHAAADGKLYDWTRGPTAEGL